MVDGNPDAWNDEGNCSILFATNLASRRLKNSQNTHQVPHGQPIVVCKCWKVLDLYLVQSQAKGLLQDQEPFDAIVVRVPSCLDVLKHVKLLAAEPLLLIDENAM